MVTSSLWTIKKIKTRKWRCLGHRIKCLDLSYNRSDESKLLCPLVREIGSSIHSNRHCLFPSSLTNDRRDWKRPCFLRTNCLLLIFWQWNSSFRRGIHQWPSTHVWAQPTLLLSYDCSEHSPSWIFLIYLPNDLVIAIDSLRHNLVISNRVFFSYLLIPMILCFVNSFEGCVRSFNYQYYVCYLLSVHSFHSLFFLHFLDISRVNRFHIFNHFTEYA